MMVIILMGDVMPAAMKSSKKEISHERILDAAARALRRGGHCGASVADVMKEAGLTHGGFYAHFSCRDEMVASAIAYGGKQSSETLQQAMAALQEKGVSPFRSLINVYLSVQHMDAIETGCVVAALGSEVPRQSEIVRQAAAERLQALIRLVESVLPVDVAKTNALLVASAIVGALQLARTLGGAQGRALLVASRKTLLARYD